MNQELLLRLFRSIEGQKNDDIVRVAERIIEDEKQKGHTKLADRLSQILKNNIEGHETFHKTLRNLLPEGTIIPTDKRNKIPLAVFIEHDELRHEMILSENIENKIHRIVSEYAARERLANYNLKPKRKILFYGTPGCGKSMSAERIAWEIGLPFLKVRFEAIVSSYLGESAANLKKMFDAIKDFPCVLLLDEIDYIAKNRSGQQDVGEMHRLVNLLLNLLEDYDAPGLLMATTNIENALDKALFRRFDDIIEIPKPGQKEIERLLKSTLSTIAVSKEVSFSSLAKKLESFSAALVVKVASDAAKYSVISGKKMVSNLHLEQAFKENLIYNK